MIIFEKYKTSNHLIIITSFLNKYIQKTMLLIYLKFVDPYLQKAELIKLISGWVWKIIQRTGQIAHFMTQEKDYIKKTGHEFLLLMVQSKGRRFQVDVSLCFLEIYSSQMRLNYPYYKLLNVLYIYDYLFLQHIITP